MEIKEKLLKLVHACLDNAEFYDKNKQTKICISSYQNTFDKIQFRVWQHKDNRISYDSKEHQKLENDLKIFDRAVNMETDYSITIDFEDSPSVVIGTRQLKTSEEIISEHLIQECSYRSNKKSNDFFAFLKKYEDKPKMAKMNLVKIEYEITSRISSGNVHAEITLEEHHEIVKKFQDNEIKFKAEFDIKKLDERLEKYFK